LASIRGAGMRFVVKSLGEWLDVEIGRQLAGCRVGVVTWMYVWECGIVESCGRGL
jgi:hypothetical protein